MIQFYPSDKTEIILGCGRKTEDKLDVALDEKTIFVGVYETRASARACVFVCVCVYVCVVVREFVLVLLFVCVFDEGI